MIARSEIQLTLGLVLVNIKTNELWTITAISKPRATRNSGGSTTKKSRTYRISHNKHEKLVKHLNRGDLLNLFRVLETPAEIVLYGNKDV